MANSGAAKSHLRPAGLVSALGGSTAGRKADFRLLSFVCSSCVPAGWSSLWHLRMHLRNGSPQPKLQTFSRKNEDAPGQEGSPRCLVLVCRSGRSREPVNPGKTQVLEPDCLTLATALEVLGTLAPKLQRGGIAWDLEAPIFHGAPQGNAGACKSSEHQFNLKIESVGSYSCPSKHFNHFRMFSHPHLLLLQ